MDLVDGIQRKQPYITRLSIWHNSTTAEVIAKLEEKLVPVEKFYVYTLNTGMVISHVAVPLTEPLLRMLDVVRIDTVERKPKPPRRGLRLVTGG